MKRLLLSFLFALATIAAVAQGFTIEKFDVAIDLKKDGSARIEERIRNADNVQPSETQDQYEGSKSEPLLPIERRQRRE